MKKSQILFAASCLLSVFGIAKFSEARVCFIVGGCPIEEIHVAANCTSLGYDRCEGEGLTGAGKTCQMGGNEYYEYCTCNKSLYKYSESQLKDTSYEGVHPVKCGEDGNIETRYMDRRCKAIYSYVSTIPSSYNSSLHNPVQLCPNDNIVDPEFGSCEEKYGISTSFERYKKCSHCPASYQTCSEASVKPASDAESCALNGKTVYSACKCADGYSTTCAGKAFTAGGITCYKCDTGTGATADPTPTLGDSEKGKYKIYYSDSSAQDATDEMVKLWNEQMTAAFGKKLIESTENLGENPEAKVMHMISGGEYADFRIVTLYPLVSNNETDWRTQLAIKSYTEDSVWIDRGIKIEDDDIDLPIFVVADLYTGRNYEEACTDAKYKTKPISFKYAGWLSGFDTVEEELMARTDKDPNSISDPYYSIKEENPHRFDNIYSLAMNDGKGCHPSMMKQGQALGIDYGNYSAWEEAVAEEETIATGGDKCLNYVLGLNADIKVPLAVEDLETKTLYIIEKKPRARVRNISWEEEEGDYVANFLLWSPAYSGDDLKEAVCTYTKAEEEGFHEDYLQTYPQFNKSWSRYNGVVSFDEFTGNARDFAEDSNVWKTYLGGDKSNMIRYRQDGEPEYSDFMNRYYQENSERIMNGKYIWSYPWLKGGIE